MKYITIVAKDFEEAVRKAREHYGPALRIHSRRDVMARGGFLWMGKRTHVELTCYLADSLKAEEPMVIEASPAKEIKPEPIVPEVVEEPAPEHVVNEMPPEMPSVSPEEIPRHETLLAHAKELLVANDFSDTFTGEALSLLKTSLEESPEEDLSIEEFELMVVDKIVSLVRIDHSTQLHPPRIFVLLGPTGVGKTTTIAKIAALYGLQQLPEYQRSVHMITIDSFRVGAFEQLNAFGNSLGLSVDKVSNEEEFYRALDSASAADLILVDTIGKSPRDKDLAVKMKALLSVPNREDCGFFLAISGAMKSQDVARSIDQYASFGLSSIIVTKMDETESIGNVLSVCHQRQMPILFFTDGQRVPKDIHKASASTMLGQLKGFTLDFGNLWVNQVQPIVVEEPQPVD
jgi:flagellar biosynthesis protein FlhF